MSKINEIIFRLVISVALCACFVIGTVAQTPTVSPSPESTKSQDTKPEVDPFAPEPAAPLPPGMTGSDTNDPRTTLAPGVYDAAEATMGIRHIALVKKPAAFQLGTNDPNSPTVQKMLGQLGISDTAKLAKP
jgi:hypothetical protein